MTALFGSGAGGRRELTAWDDAIRGGLSTTRRVGVVSLSARAGTSTVAHQLVRAVAARRSEPVLAVDVSSGDDGLAARVGAATAAPDETRASARTTAEALSGLELRDGVVGLRPRDVDDAVGAWLAEAAPIARFFDVAVTDFGARHPVVDLAACAALCDVVCLVADGRRSPAEHARSVVDALTGLPESPAVVLALVDHARDGAGVARAFSATDAHPVVAVPFDPGLASGGRPRRSVTNLALVELAAAVVAAGGAAARPADAGRRTSGGPSAHGDGRLGAPGADAAPIDERTA
ncbi:hypothetical protein ACO03V_12385 [Microbacterium sp. HMH0099]|uniref:hypothetical protein n=1 Tax=Microbacterium sp. HMH0099 TaxID=3414026 RepID=UPI003BF738A5